MYGLINGFDKLYPTQITEAYNTPVARTATRVYDFYLGLVTSETDVDNAVTTTETEYSDADRRVVTRADLNVTGDGELVSVQHYDPLGRLRLSRQLEDSAQDPYSESDGIKTARRFAFSGTHRYELVSNPYRSTSDSTMGWTRRKLDQAGRVIETETFSGSDLPAPWGTNTNSTGVVTTSYDAEFTTVTDQAGKARRSRLDGFNRLVRVDEPNASGNLGSPAVPTQPTSYEYDALDNLTQVTQGVQTRSFTYSSLSRLLSATNPESARSATTLTMKTAISSQRPMREGSPPPTVTTL